MGGAAVPMLMTRLPPNEARSAASVGALDIMGEAPMAMATFAAMFCTTRLVMLWQRGFVAARRAMMAGTLEIMEDLLKLEGEV